jgi:thymidylate synthase (FAD)
MSQIRLIDYSPKEEPDIGRYARYTRKRPDEAPVCDEDGIRIAKNCLKQGHMSVFEFAHLLFEVQCPIYVARQLMRHRNGAFLERSLRALEPPKNDGKQDGDYAAALDKYNELLACGVRKEDARAVLPLSTPTGFLWKISLRSLFNVFQQRLARATQRETRNVAYAMYACASNAYPELMTTFRDLNPELVWEEE